MKKSKSFLWTRFSPLVLREALSAFRALKSDRDVEAARFTTRSGGVTWEHDNEEEFFAAYRIDGEEPEASLYIEKRPLALSLNLSGEWDKGFRAELTLVGVSAADRQSIEKVFAVFDRYAKDSRIARPLPVIFIGHGHDPQWRDLKDHLHDQHGYRIEAYEIGARAGHTVRDILESMLRSSSFAILVMTGEDLVEGALRARQNVIHECGLFQGGLGFDRAIVLLEDGTEEFSNLHGIQQIRFSKGNIREAFGDVLATLRREFGDKR